MKRSKEKKKRNNAKASLVKASPTKAATAADGSGVRLCKPKVDTRTLWNTEQERLAERRVDKDDLDDWSVDEDGKIRGLTRIAGVDLSFFPDARHAVAAVVVLSFPDLEVIGEQCGTVELTVPYVPGYLAFREVPPLAQMVQRLSSELAPQLLFVDGNGAFHPRRCGSATHLGIIVDLPTVGIAKEVMMVGRLGKKKAETILQDLGRGDWAYFAEEGEPPLAALYKAGEGKKALVVSQGNRVSLSTAVAVTRAVTKHALPEPIRQADLRSHRAVSEWLSGIHLPTAMELPTSKKQRRRGASTEAEAVAGGGAAADPHAAALLLHLLAKHQPRDNGLPWREQPVWVPKVAAGPSAAAVPASALVAAEVAPAPSRQSTARWRPVAVSNEAAATVPALPQPLPSEDVEKDPPPEKDDGEPRSGFCGRECCYLSDFPSLIRWLFSGR